MTVNLLAHPAFFKTGIVRSDAYSLTLNPFGF
jgi:hypothetical protein